MSREVLEGTANGALFMALFGAVWAMAGAGALGGVAGVALLLVALALAAALCAGSVKARRLASRLPRDGSPQARARRRRLSRSFNLVFALEFLAIALAAVLLGRYALVTFIPSVVALIVGLHFLPLARLYGVRVYRLTGVVICALAVTSFLIAPAWRLPFVGLGCVAALFATAAYLLYPSGMRDGNARFGAKN